jgi:maleamate amidohydrolase
MAHAAETKSGIARIAEANKQVGFEGSLALGKRPALIVVDFVRAYLIKDSPLYAGVEDARLAAIDLLGLCRDVGLPVIHTNLSYQQGGRDGGVFFRKVPALRCFEQGASPELGLFGKGLEPQPGEIVITKQYPSAFFATHLAPTLTSQGIDTVLIAGVSTSGCVRATAVDCCQHGFIPVVVREAVGDRAPGPHESNLFDIQGKYGEVLGIDDIRIYLQKLFGATNAPGPKVTSERP